MNDIDTTDQNIYKLYTELRDKLYVDATHAGDQACLADLRNNCAASGNRFLSLDYCSDVMERMANNHEYGLWSALMPFERTELVIAYSDAYGDAYLEAMED